MKFLSSMEVDAKVYSSARKVANLVDQKVRKIAENSKIGPDYTLIYVPVIMPENSMPQYPSRFAVRKAKKTAECGPQLNYDVFFSGDEAEKIAEYVRGIILSSHHLSDLGIADVEIRNFLSALEELKLRKSGLE